MPHGGQILTQKNRFVLAWKMVHSADEMSKVLNGNGNGNGHGTQSLLRRIPKKATQAQTTESPYAIKESRVAFKTAEGIKLRGALSRMTCHLAVFELYSPSVMPRFSEALGEFTIVVQGRTVYSGRAVISRVLDAGQKIVCEAMLEEAQWRNVDFALLAENGMQFGNAFKNFLKEWQKMCKILPEFKVVVVDMQTFLHELRLWLDKVEVGIRSFAQPLRKVLEKEAVEHLAEPVCKSIDTFIGRFESIAVKLDKESRYAHQTYIRRNLHPLLLCAPFLNRTFSKPLGYAGDYEMVNMILRDPLQGDSLYANIVNLWFLRQPPAEAHRNRIKFLSDQVVMTVARTIQSNQTARIVSLGCGPAHEVQKFLRECHLADFTEFTLLDFSPETLAHTENALNEIKEKYTRTTRINLVKKSVNQILKEAMKKSAQTSGYYDLVYCAGLFDYLTDSVCLELTNVLYDWVAPGGLLITTNVDASNPRRLTMDYIMEWHLIYRNQNELFALKPKGISNDLCKVKSDDTGVNIYFEAQKPKHE